MASGRPRTPALLPLTRQAGNSVSHATLLVRVVFFRQVMAIAAFLAMRMIGRSAALVGRG